MCLWERTPWGIIHCVRAQKSVCTALFSSAGTVLYLFPPAMLYSLEVREREAKRICKTAVLCWKTGVYLSLSHSRGLVPRQQLLSDQKQSPKLAVNVQGEQILLQSTVPLQWQWGWEEGGKVEKLKGGGWEGWSKARPCCVGWAWCLTGLCRGLFCRLSVLSQQPLVSQS